MSVSILAQSDNVLIEQNVMVPMRDGVKLATDIYRLKTLEKGPVLISRTPYNKENVWLDHLAFVQAGYVVVVQDVRGRYASEGVFTPHRQETDDGVDCFAWAAVQPWSNGNIGTFGGSYLGGTQWLPARRNPSGLKAMIPEVTFSDLHEGCTHQGGAKVLHDLRWVAADIVADSIRRRRAAGEKISENVSRPDVDTVLNILPLAGHPAIREFAPFYSEWIEHPAAGEFWEKMSPNSGYKNITVPALNISGWYDIFIWGTLQNYRNMKQQGGSPVARNNQKLIIGPWTHMNFTGIFPERNFGLSAHSDSINLTGIKMRWFDHWLKGVANGIDREDPVMIFVMGIDQWRTEKAWPLPDTQYHRVYLHSGGGANSIAGDGVLSRTPPEAETADSFSYDPMNPVPTVGGQVILPGENSMGPRDQREVEKRNDVLVYSTPVLTQAVEVTGDIKLKLFIASSALDTDFTAKLVDVYPDGRAMILTDGILRTRYRESATAEKFMEPGKIYALTVDLQATSNVFLPGHQIRLEVSSSNFPKYSRNSNTGGIIAKESAEQYRTAVNQILHDREHPSHLILPIIKR